MMSEEENTPPSQRTIAVIDDDLGVRAALCNLLDSAGYRHCSFDCGEDFLTSSCLPVAACAIVDLNLPGMSGFELAEQLLAETTWLRELIEHMVRDPHERDDVAQEVGTLALQRPPDQLQIIRQHGQLVGLLERAELLRRSGRRIQPEEHDALALVSAAHLVDRRDRLRVHDPFGKFSCRQWFRGVAQDLTTRVAGLPDQARAVADAASATLRIAATHALSFSFLPGWLRALEANMLTPIELMRSVVDAMAEAI